MALFSRPKRTSDCPFCGLDLTAEGKDKSNHFFSKHVNEVTLTNGQEGLQLECGCAKMVWPAIDFRAGEIAPHLREVHNLDT